MILLCGWVRYIVMSISVGILRSSSVSTGIRGLKVLQQVGIFQAAWDVVKHANWDQCISLKYTECNCNCDWSCAETVFTRKFPRGFASCSLNCVLGGNITSSSAASREDDFAELTRTDCIRTRLDRACVISLVAKIKLWHWVKHENCRYCRWCASCPKCLLNYSLPSASYNGSQNDQWSRISKGDASISCFDGTNPNCWLYGALCQNWGKHLNPVSKLYRVTEKRYQWNGMYATIRP